MSAKQNDSGTFSDFEKNAIKDRAKELAAEARASKKKEAGEKIALEAIAAMPKSERDMAQKIHEIVAKVAPDLWPKTWYGMPAYAKDGKVICFFQSASKFESRYCSFGFNDAANLDEGNMWEVSYALKKITDVEEKKIAELVKKAVK